MSMNVGRPVAIHASGPTGGQPAVSFSEPWVGPRPLTRPRSNRGALLALPSLMAVAVALRDRVICNAGAAAEEGQKSAQSLHDDRDPFLDDGQDPLQ